MFEAGELVFNMEQGFYGTIVKSNGRTATVDTAGGNRVQCPVSELDLLTSEDEDFIRQGIELGILSSD